MSAKAFNSFDVANAIMKRQGLLHPQGALTATHSYDRRDMILALNGAFPSRFRVFHDQFLVDTINLDQYLLTKDATTAVDFAATAVAGSGIAGSSGTTANEGHSLWTPNVLLGDKNCFFIVRAKIDVVTSFKFEVGLADAISDKTLGAVTDVDTPSNAFGDGAVLSLEDAETEDDLTLVTEGSNSQTIAATGLKAMTDNAVSATTVDFVPTADTYYSYMVAVNGDDVHAMIFDASWNPLYRAYKADGLEGATLMSGWVFIATENTTAKVVTISDIIYMQDR